jgi:ABC-type cobalamin/Fe3+-siderophores transport system ATPase subunit
MQVHQVISQRLNVTLGRKLSDSGNYVDVITGPNGCGKTELLGNLCINPQRMCLHMRAGCGSIPAYAAI